MFLEWLQWLQWSPSRSHHPQLLDVVWCSNSAAGVWGVGCGVSCRIVSCGVVWCSVVSCRVVSCSAMLCSVVVVVVS